MYYKFQNNNSIYTYTNITANDNIILNIGSGVFYNNLFQDVENKNIVHLDLKFFTEEIFPYGNDNVSIESLVEDIEYFRKNFKINEFTIMAHSVFSYIAIAYGKKYKKFIKSIILIGSCPLLGEKNFKISEKYFNSINDNKRKQQLVSNLKIPFKNFINRMDKLAPMLWYKYENYNKNITTSNRQYIHLNYNKKLKYKDTKNAYN